MQIEDIWCFYHGNTYMTSKMKLTNSMVAKLFRCLAVMNEEIKWENINHTRNIEMKEIVKIKEW